MSDYKRQASGDECPPPPKEPADQPRAPSKGDTCKEWQGDDAPPLKEPEPCPKSDLECSCPGAPSEQPECLEILIAERAAEIAVAKKAEAFKTDLEKLLAAAKTATQEYTRSKYDALVKLWVELDRDIASFLRKLDCAAPCWPCVIECYVCPKLNELREAELRLYGDGTLYKEVNNLYDQQYWYTRDKERKERQFNRIKSVLAAWEKPATTIEAILKQNRALLDALDKAPSTESGKVVVDCVLRLVPLHLAIAPPLSPKWKTKIPKKFTQICGCDVGVPDDCCGPDVGAWSLRQRMLGPQAYLIDPNDYYMLICCLVTKRYRAAQEALGKAEADLAAVNNRIERFKGQLDAGLKKDALEKAVKAVIPGAIDCCEFRPKDNNDDDDDDSTAYRSR